ncbi:thiol:disulfide interchange protein DsbA/DsbL [Dokdonella soli]|uniref:Thiol:disulfide interchange protein n=1 Tax=Dokdonella soli TaxID=529810 RepID=A0ABP3TXP8_9GAMM
MLKRVSALLFGLAFAAFAHAEGDTFEAGKNWFAVEPAQPTSTGDKIEVVEVFSYACPACNFFQPTMAKLKAALPANAELVYLPAAFRPDEDWPTFQRGFYAAQALGILDKAHEATFDAVWKDDGTLHIADPTTHRPVSPMPSIDDVAKFYAKFGVKAEDVVGVANSFAVNTKMKRADAQLKAYGVDSTPTLIVNGKYRLTAQSAGGVDKVIPLVKFLVAKESAGK